MKSRQCAAPNAPIRSFHAARGLTAVAGALLLAAGALPAQAQTSGNDVPPRATKSAKAHAAPSEGSVQSQASYSLGVSFGTQLHGLGLGPDSVTYARLLQGVRDALAGKAVASPEDSQRVQSLIEHARTAQDGANEAAAAKFLAENGKRPGVVTTPTGLEYKIVREGHGEPPRANEQVTVNYRGTLLNGTEFDSSYKRGEPATFAVNGLVKGWEEALVLMKPGSKWELYIPPALGYGMNSPPPIPPGSLLKFEIELLSVKPAAAQAAPAPGAPPRH